MTRLLKDNQGLIYHHARRYQGICEATRSGSLEDLLQCGALGVLKAAKTYDENAGMSWATWASFAITAEMRHLLGLVSGRELPLVLSLGVPVNADDPESERLQDCVPDDSIEPFDKEPYREWLHDRVAAALADMPEDCAQAVRLTSLEGLTRREAAARLGVDGKELARLLDKGRRRLYNCPDLRAAALDEMTPYYKKKGVAAVLSSGTSVVEDIVMQRERIGRLCAV